MNTGFDLKWEGNFEVHIWMEDGIANNKAFQSNDNRLFADNPHIVCPRVLGPVQRRDGALYRNLPHPREQSDRQAILTEKLPSRNFVGGR